MILERQNLTATHLLLNNDQKFIHRFDAVFEADGCEVKRVAPRAPTMNAYAERWVQTLRVECLDHLLVLGEGAPGAPGAGVRGTLQRGAPAPGGGNAPLPEAAADDAGPRMLTFPAGEVRCRERLGGLLKHYYYAAA